MRITSRMLNETAARGGLPINQPTLLDYINKDDNSLMSVLNKSKQKSSDIMKKSNYEKIEDAAKSFVDVAKKLADDSEEGIFAKAKADGDYKDVHNSIMDLLTGYNNTIANSKTLTGTLEVFYNNMLKEIPEENSELLASVGVTVDKDGTVDIDEDKLKNADIATLESIFGKDSEFLTKLAFVGEKIADNAEANVTSLSSTYTQTGSAFSQVSSKYDFLG